MSETVCTIISVLLCFVWIFVFVPTFVDIFKDSDFREMLKRAFKKHVEEWKDILGLKSKGDTTDED